MRRRFVSIIAIPLLVCLAAFYFRPQAKRATECKAKNAECCSKKRVKPANHQAILEDLSREFIMITL